MTSQPFFNKSFITDLDAIEVEDLILRLLPDCAGRGDHHHPQHVARLPRGPQDAQGAGRIFNRARRGQTQNNELFAEERPAIPVNWHIYSVNCVVAVYF